MFQIHSLHASTTTNHTPRHQYLSGAVVSSLEMAARPLIDYAAMRSVMRTITNYKPYEQCNHFSPETGDR